MVGLPDGSPTTCSCLTKISKSVRKKADAMTNRDGLLGRPRAGECLSLAEIAGLGAAAGAVEAGREAEGQDLATVNRGFG